MAATWQRLGDAVGCTTIGANRVRIEPGRLSTPPHSHGASEEIVFVLGGSGLSWQDEQVYELRVGDCIVHLADLDMNSVVYPPLPSNRERVTLISCGGTFVPYPTGGGEYLSRVILVAERVID